MRRLPPLLEEAAQILSADGSEGAASLSFVLDDLAGAFQYPGRMAEAEAPCRSAWSSCGRPP